MKPLPLNAVLLVIDFQKAIDHPGWGERNNPDAEKHVASLLQAWRTTRRPVYHVRHDSTETASHYRPGQPGNDFKPEAQPASGEIVIVKRTNSAFIGTDLESRLRHANHNLLIVTGVITNNSVEATVGWRETWASTPSWSRMQPSPSAARTGTELGDPRTRSTP